MANYQITNRTGAQIKTLLDNFTTPASPNNLTLTGAISGGSLTASGAISGGTLSIAGAIYGGTTLVIGTQKSGTTLGTNATILGYNGTASGAYSHAQGYSTTASGNQSHAEGTVGDFSTYYLIVGNNMGKTINGSSAYGVGSHAEGGGSVALGDYSHTQGKVTLAIGDYSHAQGYYTIAPSDYSTAIGKFNEAVADFNGATRTYTYTNAGDYAFVIGNGTGFQPNQRSNALTVSWDGELIANGQSFRNACKIIEKTTNVSSLTNTTCKWRYRKFSNGYIDGYGIISATWSHYTTFSSFYGYYCTVQLPEQFIGDGVTATVSWNIGNAFGVSAGVKGPRTTEMNIYALSSASGAQAIIAMIHIKGRIAAPLTRYGTMAINNATASDNSVVVNNVSYLLNADADDRLISFTTSGTSNSDTRGLVLYDTTLTNGYIIPSGTYYFSCTPSGGASNTYSSSITIWDTVARDYLPIIRDTGEGCTFTFTDTQLIDSISVTIKANTNANNKIWRPQLFKLS